MRTRQPEKGTPKGKTTKVNQTDDRLSRLWSARDKCLCPSDSRGEQAKCQSKDKQPLNILLVNEQVTGDIEIEK